MGTYYRFCLIHSMNGIFLGHFHQCVYLSVCVCMCLCVCVSVSVCMLGEGLGWHWTYLLWQQQFFRENGFRVKTNCGIYNMVRRFPVRHSCGEFYEKIKYMKKWQFVNREAKCLFPQWLVLIICQRFMTIRRICEVCNEIYSKMWQGQ